MDINTDSINGAIKNYEIIDDGALLCWLTIGCTGELDYSDTTHNRIEVVNTDTLYGDDSINTAVGRPIVLTHPPKPIIGTLQERKRYEKGVTLQEIRKVSEDGIDYLNIASLITDPSLVKMILDGSISQVSPCYRSTKELINADSNGVNKYLQKNRKYNHFAFTTNGRHGKEVKVYLSGINKDSIEETMNVKNLVELHLKFDKVLEKSGVVPDYNWDSITLKKEILKVINPDVDPSEFDEVNCDSVLMYAGDPFLKQLETPKESTKTETKTETPKESTKAETKTEAPKESTKVETKTDKVIVPVPAINEDSTVSPISKAERLFIETVQKRNAVTK